MKRLLLLFSLLLLLVAAAPQQAQATHAQGADITYRWIGPNQYRMFLRFYRDRTGAATPTTVDLLVRDARLAGCANADTVTLQPLFPASFDSLGSNLCSSLLQQFNGLPPYGSDVSTFSGIVSLPWQSDQWTVVFSLSARPDVANLTSAGNIVSYAIINNSTVAGQYEVRNTSIQYANDPASSLAESKQNPLTFYTCVGQPYEVLFNFLNPTYGQFTAAEAQPEDAALNPTGDSLAFSLVPALSQQNFSPSNCFYSAAYYTSPLPSSTTNIQLFDSTSNRMVPAIWTLPHRPFSATWPLPSHTMQFLGAVPGFARLYEGTPYFDFDNKTGRMKFRPSLYRVNYQNQGGTTDPNDKYVVCVLVEEYRKIRLNKVDGQGQSFTKDTTIFVGAVRRDAMIYVSQCGNNPNPRFSQLLLPPTVSPTIATVSDSLTRIVVPRCDTLFFASLKFEDRDGAGVDVNAVSISWANPLAAGSNFANAISTSFAGNNTPEAVAWFTVRPGRILRPNLANRDSVELVFRVQDQQCPNPSQILYRIRLVFESPISGPSPSVTASGPVRLCEGDSVTLTAQGGTRWQWSSGETTQSITVRNGGQYSVKSLTGVCQSPPSTAVQVVTSTVYPAVGPIQQINDTLKVSEIPDVTYSWTLNGAPLPNGFGPVITFSDPGVYEVTALSRTGCAARQRIIITSIASQLTHNLRIFPNPAHGEVRLTSSKRCQYRIVNVLGQPIVSGQLAADLPTDLNLRHWPSGLYVVQVQGSKPQYLVVE